MLTVFEQEWRKQIDIFRKQPWKQIVVGSTWTVPLGALSVHCIVWSLARGGLLMHVPWAHASWMSWGGPSSWWSQEDWNCQGWHPEQKSGEETRTRQLWYVLLFFCYYVIFRFFFHVSFYDNIMFHFYSFLDFALRSCGFEQTTRGESIAIVILVAHSWCLALLQHGRCWSILQRSKESCQALHWLTFVADSRSAAAQKTDSLGDGTAVAAGGPAVTSCRPDLLRSCVAVGQRCSSFAKI